MQLQYSNMALVLLRGSSFFQMNHLSVSEAAASQAQKVPQASLSSHAAWGSDLFLPPH